MHAKKKKVLYNFHIFSKKWLTFKARFKIEFLGTGYRVAKKYLELYLGKSSSG